MKICIAEKCEKHVYQSSLCRHHYHIKHRKRINAAQRAWAKNHPKNIRKHNRNQYIKNREKMNAHSRAWSKAHAERVSVISHHHAIFSPKNVRHANYKGMPFFDDWNPDMCGSFRAGAQWIINNIGRRPGSGKEYHLHIVDRKIGFVPGNLQWVPRERHQQEEMIAKLLLENQDLRRANAELTRAGSGQ